MVFDLSTMSVRKKDRTPGCGYVLAAVLAVFCARFLFVSVTTEEGERRISAETQAVQAALPQINRVKAQIQACVADESCVKAGTNSVLDLGRLGAAPEGLGAVECLRAACHEGPNGAINVKVGILGVIEADAVADGGTRGLIERPVVSKNGVVEWAQSARGQ